MALMLTAPLMGFEDKVRPILEKNCLECHGGKKVKGEVDYSKILTEKAEQPSEPERKVLMQWFYSQLTGDAAKALAERLQRFESDNVVKHEDLFSGKHVDLPAYTHDRRWMTSEYIFSEKTNSSELISPIV